MSGRRAVALAVAAGTLAAAGCGEERLSAADYRRQANAICRDAERSIDGIQQPTEATGPAFSRYLSDAADAAAKPVERLQALKPPEDLQTRHESYVDATRASVGKLRDLARRVRGAKGPRELRAVAERVQQDIATASTRSRDTAKALDLTDCAT